MCDICLHTPCLHGCPNEDLSEGAVYQCTDCENYIYDGDEYMETKKGIMCWDCFTEYTDREKMELLGIEIEKAVMPTYE